MSIAEHLEEQVLLIWGVLNFWPFTFWSFLNYFKQVVYYDNLANILMNLCFGHKLTAIWHGVFFGIQRLGRTANISVDKFHNTFEQTRYPLQPTKDLKTSNWCHELVEIYNFLANVCKSLKSDTNIILETKYLLKCWFKMDLLFYGFLQIWWQSHVRCLTIWLDFFIVINVTIRLSLVPLCKHHDPERSTESGGDKKFDKCIMW